MLRAYMKLEFLHGILTYLRMFMVSGDIHSVE